MGAARKLLAMLLTALRGRQRTPDAWDRGEWLSTAPSAIDEQWL